MSAPDPPDFDDLRRATRPAPPGPEWLRPKDVVWIGRAMGLAAIGLIGWQWAAEASKFKALQHSLDARYSARKERLETAAADDERALHIELQRLKTEHAKQMMDTAVLDGSKARELREAEWRRRQAHDPQLARSLAEKSLLQMEALGASTQISAQAALEKVAALAAPAGSRIEVTKQGSHFAVKVAYRMSALTEGESGAATKHTSKAGMRAEIRQLSAQVMRDLFTYCGSRGIASVSLTCNHTTMSWLEPPGATEEEKVLLRERAKKTQSKLHRVVLDAAAARNISNWRRASDDEILNLLRVEYDGIDSIQITKELRGDKTESADPLIF